MSETNSMPGNGYGPHRLSIELTNICNLHCSYCLRDEDALYHDASNFLGIEFLQKVVNRARDVMGITHLTFTGGEPTLHPDFPRILGIAEASGLTSSFVTNGWHFERVWPAVLERRASIKNIAFSLDGVSRDEHDHWRGEGSFIRLAKAFSRCYATDIPFSIKVVIRRDTLPNLEKFALFAARMGAGTLSFVHVMPTSLAVEDTSTLSLEERSLAEQEIANLSRIFKMKIGIDVGYYNLDESPPCSALARVSCNIDYRGRMTLCCNLSGFRGAIGEKDVVADLNVEDFGPAYARFSRLANDQLEARQKRLAILSNQGIAPDLQTGSPCLFCLSTFSKVPWHQRSRNAEEENHSLPVLQTR